MVHAARLVILILSAGPAWAGPSCTSAPAEKWLPQDEMRRRIEADGYRIGVFKTTSGNCFEIYGRDKDGRRVEVYFDPVSGAVVKANTR